MTRLERLEELVATSRILAKTMPTPRAILRMESGAMEWGWALAMLREAEKIMDKFGGPLGAERHAWLAKLREET